MQRGAQKSKNYSVELKCKAVKERNEGYGGQYAKVSCITA